MRPLRRTPTRAGVALLVLALAALAAAPAAAQTPAQAPVPNDSLVRWWIAPSVADGSVHRFDEPNYVVASTGVRPDAPLLVFMPGTGGRPSNTSDFADEAARRGYRVIGLQYDDTPAVAQVCPREPDPSCSERFRRKRIYGESVFGAIDDRPNESIEHRLAMLLAALERAHPGEGWGSYLTAAGTPRWERIAVSGLSQGAGMAAYVATRTPVARVILFSSPWDSYGPRRTLAPWVTAGPGATPPERWYAVYHAKEPTADQIARAYDALRIPTAHVRVFALEPATGSARAYHPSSVANGATPRTADGAPAYLADWRFLLGDVRSAP